MDTRLTRRFASFYFLLFLPIGMHAPYLFLYFKRQGFTDSQLGTLAAMTPLLNVFAPPLWGALADSFGDRRRTLAIGLLCSALLFPWLMFSQSFWLTLALLVAFSAFAFPPAAIADAIALENVERKGGDYGRLRLWGSLGFAAPLLAFGAVLKGEAGQPAASLYPIFWGYAIFRLISAGWVWLLPPSYGTAAKAFDFRAARVFLSGPFLALAVCGVLATGAMAGYYVYFTIYLDEMGIADSLKGYFWAIAVIAETGMLVVIGRVMDRIGLRWTFVLGVAGCSVRLLAYSFPLGAVGIAAAQCLHALTFTALTVSAITFVNRMAPPELRASGQTLWMALNMGLGSAVGSKLAGMAAGAAGLLGMYRIFAAAAAVAALAAVVFVRERPPAPPLSAQE
jgi:PPP family 3-phenylpropionic acid transporter